MSFVSHWPLALVRQGLLAGTVGLCSLEHDPEKWKPVFRKDHALTKKLDHHPIQLDRIMVWRGDDYQLATFS
jgi:hypothetical protein